ncbi:nuclear transport factor 2 family protein [Streptomyces sp. NPDC051940]|uniref:nuclear transport factor 2 family protein n=1 Tax=Streptomyces sp. NPDC051940 TaxID=3155675 RepID=UPI003443CD2D
MTQRTQLAVLTDRLAVDDLVSGYAAAVDDGDWTAYRALFVPAGRADYRSAGGIEGPAAEVGDWLARMLALFQVRQHLITNRRISLDQPDGEPGDTAEVHADYVNPMLLARAAPEPAAPNFVTGGRYHFHAVRDGQGWRLRTVVVHEKWRLS